MFTTVPSVPARELHRSQRALVAASLLASMHAELLGPVPAGTPLAVVGWSLGGEGRKHRSATAILDADGRVLARAAALWIRIRG